jgi:exosortase D (VPLPA-CTERM-specific)
MEEFSTNSKRLRVLLLTALSVAFLYWSVLLKLGHDWWTDENYSHGLLVPFVIALIVWLEFKAGRPRQGEFVARGESAESDRSANGKIWPGCLMVILGLVMLVAGTLGAELFVQRISLVLMLAGIVVYFFGAAALRTLAVPFLLLLLAIPIPQILFNQIAIPLQMWASQLATWGIRLCDVSSIRHGNVIELLPVGASQVVSLEVVEACSGIRSLMTLVTLAVILAYFTSAGRRCETKFWRSFDFWRTVILMLSAAPIAVVTNAARVTLTALVTYEYGTKISEDWHGFSGWMIYVAALVLLGALNYVLKKLHSAFAKSGDGVNTQAETASRPQFNLRANVSASLLLVTVFAGGLFINWLGRRGEAPVERNPLASFPKRLGVWEQKGNDMRFSEQTESVLRATDYVQRDYLSPDGGYANLYIGYYASQQTGATHHSPLNCLPGSGWELSNPGTVEIRTPGGKVITASSYIVTSGDIREVLVYWYEGRGRSIASEYRDKVFTVIDSLLRRRSDGSMVRIITPTGNNDALALQKAVEFSALTEDNLSPFIPD